ncbi:nascent polypeptide-associated complex protein [Candidatus Woesearchaeota archaeon]|nr:nascent polypeptide-associated complex protein [Candidatus Woesearchaeota archaeon]
MRMDERALKAAMRKMGIQSQDIPATEVIIRSVGRDIVISNPSVTRVNMMGQDTFQVIGTAVDRVVGENPDDVTLVMEQAGVSHDAAVNALRLSKGDLAEAIVKLKKS